MPAQPVVAKTCEYVWCERSVEGEHARYCSRRCKKKAHTQRQHGVQPSDTCRSCGGIMREIAPFVDELTAYDGGGRYIVRPSTVDARRRVRT